MKHIRQPIRGAGLWRLLPFAMAAAVALLCLWPSGVMAQGKLATRQPTFQESGHVPPSPDVPPPRALLAEYGDVLALVVALSLAAYLALGARSRRGLVWLSVLCLLYFGFWRRGCVCPVGSVQNMMEALVDHSYAVPLVVVLFFAVPLVFTLFFGRVFCSSVCPLGAIQDVVLLRPVKLPVQLTTLLGLIPFLYLGLALTLVAGGGGYLICRYDPFIGFFRMGASLPMVLFGAGMLLLATVVGRPYCRFLCPYGVLLNGCSRLSSRHVTITPDTCVQCRLCESACPFGAILAPVPERMAESRAIGIRRLALLLALLPVLVAGGAVLGGQMAVPLSRLSTTVQLAERVRLEETGVYTGTTVETEGFRRTGTSFEELYAQALGIRRRLGRGGWFLGGFVGVVIGGQLLALARRPRRTDYVPDRGTCLSCARCFAYCPKDAQKRREAATHGKENVNAAG